MGIAVIIIVIVIKMNKYYYNNDIIISSSSSNKPGADTGGPCLLSHLTSALFGDAVINYFYLFIKNNFLAALHSLQGLSSLTRD